MGNISLNINIKTKSSIEVTDKEFVMEDEVTGFELLLNGNPMDGVADQIIGKKTKTTRSLDGKVIKTEAGASNPMAESPRYQAMMAFATPSGKVKVGDEIVKDIPGNKEKGIVPSRGKMTVKAVKVVNGINMLELEVAYSELEGERPMGMVGTVLVEAATGILHSIKAALNDVSMNPMMPPMNMTLDMARIPVQS